MAGWLGLCSLKLMHRPLWHQGGPGGWAGLGGSHERLVADSHSLGDVEGTVVFGPAPDHASPSKPCQQM